MGLFKITVQITSQFSQLHEKNFTCLYFSIFPALSQCSNLHISCQETWQDKLVTTFYIYLVFISVLSWFHYIKMQYYYFSLICLNRISLKIIFLHLLSYLSRVKLTSQCEFNVKNTQGNSMSRMRILS